MSVLVLDSDVAERIKAARVVSGSDRWDEVWDGVYVMSPLPNNEHQQIVAGLVFVLQTVIGMPGLGSVFPGVNVSDQEDDWTKNYRCPDVAVFLRGGSAINRQMYWYGGPDFAVEIVSPEDRAREKIPFYAKVGVRELLIIDRDPWTLELYRLHEGALNLVGTCTDKEPRELPSAVVPLTFRVDREAASPRIQVTQSDGALTWTV
jgi:Uma2 family endonuclease